MDELQSFYQQKQYDKFTAQLTFMADFVQEQFNQNPPNNEDNQNLISSELQIMQNLILTMAFLRA